MKLNALQMWRALFSSNGHESTIRTEEPGPRDYSPSEIASLQQEIAENSDLAQQVAQSRGYKRNPRIAAAGIT